MLDSHYYQVGRAIDSLLAMTLDANTGPVPPPVMTGNDIIIGRSRPVENGISQNTVPGPLVRYTLAPCGLALHRLRWLCTRDPWRFPELPRRDLGKSFLFGLGVSCGHCLPVYVPASGVCSFNANSERDSCNSHLTGYHLAQTRRSSCCTHRPCWPVSIWFAAGAPSQKLSCAVDLRRRILWEDLRRPSRALRRRVTRQLLSQTRRSLGG